MADQNVDVSSMVTLRYLMLMLVFIANMHVHAQRRCYCDSESAGIKSVRFYCKIIVAAILAEVC